MCAPSLLLRQVGKTTVLLNLLPAVARLHPFFKPGGEGEATFVHMDVSDFNRQGGVRGFLRSLVTAATSRVGIPLSELLPPDAPPPASPTDYSQELEAMKKLYARLPRTKTHFFLIDEVRGARVWRAPRLCFALCLCFIRLFPICPAFPWYRIFAVSVPLAPANGPAHILPVEGLCTVMGVCPSGYLCTHANTRAV